MKMNKLFAGLIAFVAGVALSAGSAFAATNGYMVGDAANMKLVPYYETGEMKATIIGIQNMSPQEASTVALNADVTDIEAVLAGGLANANAAGLITGVGNGQGICQKTDLTTCLPSDPPDPTRKANAEAALEKAKAATYTEHMFVTVNAYDAMGVMMDDASATLCLAEGQFGVVVLQGAASMGGNGHMMQTLSVADGDIAEYGYVEIMSGTKKYTGCVASTPDGLSRVDNDADATNPLGPTDNSVSSWTIIQDTGDGFFGTEVASATITKGSNNGPDGTAGNADDGDPELGCHASAASNTLAPNITGNFDTAKCGLIPARHNQGALNNTETTVRATVHARYDAGDDSTVYVWLAKGMDTENTLPKDRRMLDVTVMCEDGMMPAGPDRDGDNKPDGIQVAAPGMVTMVDPIGDELMDYTDQCEGDRGVLKITMPSNSYAGMVFSHVQQMMGHYRMNFPGYSSAPSGGNNQCTDSSAASCR